METNARLSKKGIKPEGEHDEQYELAYHELYPSVYTKMEHFFTSQGYTVVD